MIEKTISNEIRDSRLGHLESTRDIIIALRDIARKNGYTLVDEVIDKPWGGFLRFDTSDAGDFLVNFFPNLTLKEAQLGVKDAELSPKFLVVDPGARLSWQKHDRRAERWAFLTRGGYYKSDSDIQGDMTVALPGDVVQFAQGERHRLVGDNDGFTLVAEIWQHTVPGRMSDESDIVRISDDYHR